jgi:hypothetical protein
MPGRVKELLPAALSSASTKKAGAANTPRPTASSVASLSARLASGAAAASRTSSGAVLVGLLAPLRRPAQ